jgi:hypothetical protein
MRVGLSTVLVSLYPFQLIPFPPLVVLLTSDDILGDLFFPSLFCVTLPASPVSHVHFILRIFTARLCVVLQFLFQLVSLSARVLAKPTRSLGRSLRVLATLFSRCLFILLRFDVNTRRTLPLPLSHSPFNLPATALFRPPLHRCLCRS